MRRADTFGPMGRSGIREGECMWTAKAPLFDLALPFIFD